MYENRKKNKLVFNYNNKNYTYDEIYNLVRTLDYHKSDEDCDWNIVRAHDIKDDKDCYCVIFEDCNIDELKLYMIGFSVSEAGFSIFEYTSMNLFTVIQFTLYFVAIEFILLLFL